MFVKKLKNELFHCKKAFFEYHNGFLYLKNRYFASKKILSHKKIYGTKTLHPDLSIHILTGRSHFIMMLWSMVSFFQSSNISGDLYIHNDGTLNEEDKNTIKKFFPMSQIVEPDQVLTDHKTEIEKYPVIHQFRKKAEKFFLLRKLIDPYFVSDKSMHLILDSDLLWFQEEKLLQSEIRAKAKHSLIMKNNMPIYITYKNGKPDEKSAMMNSGIVLYHKQNFNLDKLEQYFQNVDLQHPDTLHFIEQAGYAYCLENVEFLPVDLYHIKGPVTDKTIVKHYTSPRRVLFYTEGMKKIKI